MFTKSEIPFDRAPLRKIQRFLFLLVFLVFFFVYRERFKTDLLLFYSKKFPGFGSCLLFPLLAVSISVVISNINRVASGGAETEEAAPGLPGKKRSPSPSPPVPLPSDSVASPSSTPRHRFAGKPESRRMQPGILQRAPSMLGPHRQALREEAKCFERSFSQKGSAGVMASAGACGGKGDDSSPLAGVVKHKILSFRDVLDLPTRNAPDTLDELLLGTLEDLRKLYPRCASGIQTSNINRESIYEVLLHFYEALKMVGDIWAEKCNQKEKFQSQEESIENLGFEQLGERVLERLDIMSSEGKCTFDLMEKDPVNTFVVESGQGKMYYYGNPLTPTSVLPETPEANSNLKDISNIAYVPPLLRPLRLQAVGKLKPIDVKRLSFHMFPVVLDQNSQPLHEGKKSADDRELKPLDASMIVQPNPTDETGNGDGTRHSEARTLVSTPSSSHGMQLRKQQPPPTSSPEASPMLPSTPNTQPPMSTGQVPRVVSKNCCGDDIGKSSEATVPVSPSLPISNLRATLPSATPTPPPSPMLLNGLPMFFRSSSFRGSDMEPIAYAITMDDYDQVGYGELYEAVMEASPPNQSMTPPPPSSILTTNEASLPTTSALPPEWSAQSSIPSITENRSKPSSIEFLAQKSPATVSPSPPPPPPLPPPPNRPSLSAPCPSQPSKGPTPPAPPPPPPRIGSASSAPPPPPPLRGSASSAPSPPPPPRGPASSAPPPPPPPFASSTQPQNGSGPPPPPPVGVARTALRAKKASTKLKRSTQMGNLYRLLKGKVEGSCLDGKTSQGRKGQVGCSSNGKKGQGMADALAEMTKRSAYFQQIEEDVKKHAASILEMKSAINSFKTKDMKDLIEFHQLVEQHLENLSDETQVLARFEGFPYKKLETIRMAVALYSKLDGVVTTLRSWKLVAPIAQQLNKVECYFNKIKEEMDMIERKKDEESKRFQSNNIDFDFGILIRIKESMVDLSSSCIEMALKESKEAKEMGAEAKPKSNGLSKMLWRAFQLAFRVYNFAGGQDDRADRLTSELAHEIETNQS